MLKTLRQMKILLFMTHHLWNSTTENDIKLYIHYFFTGQALLKTLRQMKSSQRLENRNQLVLQCHMGPNIYVNCAGFIRIDTAALGDSDTYVEVLDGSRIHPEVWIQFFFLISGYRISSYNCRGNYSFLEVTVWQVWQLFKGGNYCFLTFRKPNTIW